MLPNVVARTAWSSLSAVRRLGVAEIRANVPAADIASKLSLARVADNYQCLHTSSTTAKAEDRKEMMASMPKKDEGTEGEVSVDIDSGIKGFGGMFPDENTPDLMFDGVRFADLPILHVKISKNNTIMALTDAKGELKLVRSCGVEGFKNCRKGTNVAAQATGISLATRAVDKGFKNIRVKVKGLGPGRMSGIKGVTMGGLNVVSITDMTFINWLNNPRPKKARKL
ncbi:small ribosomal subunit protein uS11m [Macrobrachium rosenbergii]|uniref:small ribosomal subunit protein uS11m n=1 Tax=Macrobrachium rosenbergii TaxID=79674 RepID=UPI0034D71106